jgi:hypothetical protein
MIIDFYVHIGRFALAMVGGGYGLFTRSAAGDTAISVVVKVS